MKTFDEAVTALLLIILLLTFLFGGCGDNLDPGQPSTTSFSTVHVRVTEDADLPPLEILHACSFWNEVGVQCLLVKDVLDTDIDIVANHDTCVRSSETPLAEAVLYDATIVVFAGCLARLPDGSLVLTEYRQLIAHEIGHTLGIWDHVQDRCDGKEPVYGDRHLCGRAVMNPYIGTLPALTDLDKLAFEHRDEPNVLDVRIAP